MKAQNVNTFVGAKKKNFFNGFRRFQRLQCCKSQTQKNWGTPQA